MNMLDGRELRSARTTLAVYSWCHLCVDALCCYLLYSVNASPLLMIVLYHMLAFAFQPVIGELTDRYRRFPYGKISIVLVLAGFVFLKIPAIAITLAGVGNALFHLEGGYVSLHMQLPTRSRYSTYPELDAVRSVSRVQSRIAPGGIFVGPGALGIGIGTICGKLGFAQLGLFMLLFLLVIGGSALILLFVTPVSEPTRSGRCQFGTINKNLSGKDITWILLLLAIVIRGYAGMITPVTELGGWMKILVVAVIAMTGKMLGGVMGDKIGVWQTAVFSQILAALLMIAGFWLPTSIASVFCINLPMAITLAALSDCFPDRTGLAFGLAPLGLYIGYMINYAIAMNPFIDRIVAAVLLIISGVMLGIVLDQDRMV